MEENKMEKIIFGIDIGGTSIKCGMFTEQGELKEKWEIKTRCEDGGKNVPTDIAEAVLGKMKEYNLTTEDVLGMGVGVPGPVKEDGMVTICANLGWRNVNVKETMEQLTGLKVAAANDANVATLGEMWRGGAKGYNNVVMITLGTGVGGGVIVEGKIVAGSLGAAGEIGHMLMNPEETEACGCGKRGHLEQYASATGIVRMAKKLLAETEEASVLRNAEEISAKAIFDAAKENDALALKAVDILCRMLATALEHVATVVDPEVFVIGGGVSRAGEILTVNIEKYYNELVMSALAGKKFVLATLGNDAGIYGSAKMALDLAK